MPPDERRVLGADIRKHGLREPVVVQRQYRRRADDSIANDHDYKLVLLDGIGRLDSMEEAGFPLVRDGKLDKTLGHAALGLKPLTDGAYAELDFGIDPYDFVVSRNILRRHLNAKQRRELIAKLLKADASKSDRQIGEMIKADHKTVGAVRAEKEATGEISPVEKRVGKDRKARKQPVKKATTAKSPRAAQEKATEAQETKAARKPKSRDDIGPASNDEITRKDARIEELQADKRRLEIENMGLRSEVEETKAVCKPEGEGEGSELGNLLRAWDRASPGAREKFKARVGLVAVEPPVKVMDDGLDIPECLRRAAP
jgi:hypothetical protein